MQNRVCLTDFQDSFLLVTVHFRMMTQWRFKRGVEEQMKAFLDGFNEVVPLQWLQFFDERELELMLCGMQELNANEWEKHTVYRNYTRNSKQIQWFWQVCCVDTVRHVIHLWHRYTI